MRFAGFLPLRQEHGEWWALLGEEQDGWGAFGGGPENGETPGDTAVREAYEESHGVLLRPALRAALGDAAPLVHTSLAQVFGVVVPKEVARRMTASFARHAHRAAAHGCFEKTKVAWVPLRCLYMRRKRIGSMTLRAPLVLDAQAVAPILAHLQYRPALWHARAWARAERARDRECLVDK